MIDEHAGDPQLSHLDDRLPKAYAQARAAATDEDMRPYARDFIASRHACGADRACILGNMSASCPIIAMMVPLDGITAPVVAGGRARSTGALPPAIGRRGTPTVTDISPRIDTFDSGTEKMEFANQGQLVSYDPRGGADPFAAEGQGGDVPSRSRTTAGRATIAANPIWSST